VNRDPTPASVPFVTGFVAVLSLLAGGLGVAGSLRVRQKQ